MNSIKTSASSWIKHLAHCALLFTFISVSVYSQVLENRIFCKDKEEMVEVIPAFVYFLRLKTIMLVFPFLVFGLFGLIFYNAFPPEVRLKGSPDIAPFLCFRTVVSGGDPDLVRESVRRNLETCQKTGLVNFVLEVVTEKPFGHSWDDRIRILVIPPSYQTNRGALYKTRGLQYCLEDDVNTLNDGDWIVHLDEETLLTEDSVKGIVNFVLDGQHQFGQGLITYANETVDNWLTTFLDFTRVADDMGKLRFQFKMFRRPLLGWKGSFMVCLAEAEKNVSFDHGVGISLAESLFFAMMAYKDGYSFGFIEGEMWEKSPFTVGEFLKKRRLWARGAMLILKSRVIPLRFKFFYGIYTMNYIVLPITVIRILLEVLFPPPCTPWTLCALRVAKGAYIYMYIYGGLKSLSVGRLGMFRFYLCMFSLLCLSVIVLLLDSGIASLIFSDHTRDLHFLNQRIDPNDRFPVH